MHDPERRALVRAAVLLLAISAARWGVESRGSAHRSLEMDDVLASHLAATTAAVEEEDRRTRPLEEGERIDPNAADVVELDRLPGVGPATAAAIVEARTAGSVFRRPEDLVEVKGIGPATLRRMRPWLDLPGAGVTTRIRGSDAPAATAAVGRAVGRTGGPVDINRADEDELQRLPGIGPALARRVVEARRAGPYSSVDDLERVRGIGPATVDRLRHLAVAGPGR